MMYHQWQFTSELVKQRNREAEQNAQRARLYREAGLEPFGGLRAGVRRLAALTGGWLVAAGKKLAATGASGAPPKRVEPCACS